MTTDVDSSSPEKQFPRRLSRKTLLAVLPTIFIPVIIAIIDITILTKYSYPSRIIGIFIICIVIGSIYAFLLKRLVKNHIITPVEKIIDTTRRFTLGDLKDRTHLVQDDEIGLLAFYIDRVGEILFDRFKTLEVEVNTRDIQLRITSDLAQIIASASDQQQLLQQSIDLITERFNHYKASIYLLNKTSDQAVLNAVSGQARIDPHKTRDKILISDESTFWWVAKNNQPKIIPFPVVEPLSSSNAEFSTSKSAVAIPISTGEKVWGIILVEDRNLNAFNQGGISTLHTIANQIAASVQNRLPKERISSAKNAASLLYQASHTIITAGTEMDIFTALKNTLRQLPYSAALFMADQARFPALYRTDRSGHDLGDGAITEISIAPFSANDIIQASYPISIKEPQDLENLPEPLISICNTLQFDSLNLLPLVVNGKVAGMLFIGDPQGGILGETELDYISNLIEISVTSLEKVNALRTISDQLNELQTLNSVSQSISTETNMVMLYQVIHQQINQVMGSVNFLIALFEETTSQIEIPYMDDGNQIINVPPFPLGRGLTSIIIRTRQPLMIVEDTVNRSRALGAIVTGEKPALSWLGVPMILGGDIIGAIVVQDLEREHRFDENDMRLLTTLAAQVAIAVHNTRLIETAQLRAERDRQLYEITDKIRRAVDIPGIIETTAKELCKTLGTSHATIEISPATVSQFINGNGVDGWKDVSE